MSDAGNGANLAPRSVTYDPDAEQSTTYGISRVFRVFLNSLASACEDIPDYGTAARERYYRELLRLPEYGTLAGAVSIMVKKATGWQWQLIGGSDRMREFLHKTINERAQFGQGYTALMSLCSTDFYSQDKGLFYEIIDLTFPDEKDDKRSPLRPPAFGLAHLDAARCELTRDPIWPVIYWNPATGNKHILHHTRVVHIADMPSPDYQYAGLGQCGVGRAIQRAQILARQGTLESERMSNMPMPGVVVFNNVKLMDVQEQYENQLDELALNIFKDILAVQSLDPDRPVTVDFTAFASLPEAYDPQREFTLAMLTFALAFGEDVRTFTALSEGQLGTAAEAEVKREVARGMVAAYLRARWAEAMNNKVFAGTNVVWEWVAQDEAQERIRAETVKIQEETVTNTFVAGELSRDEARRNLHEIGLLTEDELNATGETPDAIPGSESERTNGCNGCGGACATKSRQQAERPDDRDEASDIERRTNEYQAEIDNLYVAWMSDLTRELDDSDPVDWPKIIQTSVAALIAAMVALGRERITQSFSDGLEGFDPTPIGLSDLDTVVMRNGGLLQNSLGVDLLEDLLVNAPSGDVELMATRMAAKRARVNTYAGPFFRVFWYGVGDRHRQLDVLPRVRRELDRRAKHCPDCPPKEGIYEDYITMSASVGVPGDDTNQCGCNCRCRLFEEIEPDSDEWRAF